MNALDGDTCENRDPSSAIAMRYIRAKPVFFDRRRIASLYVYVYTYLASRSFGRMDIGKDYVSVRAVVDKYLTL